MNALVEQVRAHVDQEVARELSQPDETSRPAARRFWVGVLVAAALVLGIGIGTLQATRFLEDDRPNDQSAALHSGLEGEGETLDAEQREPKPEPEPEPEPELEPEPLPEEDVDADADAEPTTTARRSRRHEQRRARARKPAPVQPQETLEEKLARLDQEAHAAWKAGQLARAEQLFGEITRLDKRGKLAGLAYGDLFTLARQRGNRAREIELWKRYLKRFPRGRFTDDARAGLCRAARGDARAQCWLEYLEDMPKGSYRAQARREAGGGGTP